MVLTVARKRFEQEIPLQNSTNTIGRPSEGDLIYFPLNNKIFEVKFVEHESVFYQMGSLQTYDLRCELFEYSHERLNTGIAAIDGIEDAYSADLSDRQILDEAGNNLIFESGEYIADDVQTDQAATNILFDTKSNDFLDFSEVNPFGEGGEW